MTLRNEFSSQGYWKAGGGSAPDLSSYASKQSVAIRRFASPHIVSGVNWKPPNNWGASADYTSAAGRTIFQPFYCPPDINLADFVMKVTSKATVTSGQAMLALYLMDETTWKPTTRVAISGNLDMSVSANVGSLDLVGATTPSDRWYCQAISCDTPVLTLQGQSAVWTIGGMWGCNSSGSEYVAVIGTKTYGATTLTNPAPDVPATYTLQVNAIQPMLLFTKR